MASELSGQDRQLSAKLCERFPEWAPEESRPPRIVERLSGGHSNCVLLLAGEHNHWILRIAGANGPNNICRSREVRLQAEAARRGFAARVVWSDTKIGALLMEYLPGTKPLSAPIDIAVLLRKIHALPMNGKPLDASAILEEYQGLIDCTGNLAKLLNRNRGVIERAQRVIASSPGNQVLCHNDLLAANRCWHEQRMIAFDWEYAAPADAFFELAVCASELSEPEAKVLLNSYLERPAEDGEHHRYVAFQIVYRCLEACWHVRFSNAVIQEKLVGRLQRDLEGGLTL